MAARAAGKTAGEPAAGGVGQPTRRSVLLDQAHVPVRDPRLWAVGAMVVFVALVHLFADLAQDRGTFPAPGFVWILLFLVPIV